MAEMLVVTIGADGEVSVDAHGYKGASCQEAIRFISRLGKSLSTERKPEFYEAQQVAQQNGRVS